MRRINTIEDAQKVINELLDWKDLITTKEWNLHRLRIKNASPAVDPNDYVILSQLPKVDTITNKNDQNYAIYFTATGTVLTGDIIPDAIIGESREGVPREVYLSARTPPSNGDLEINISINGVNLLSSNLVLPEGNTNVMVSSNFSSPIPVLGYKMKVHPIIVNGGSAAGVSIVISVRRILK